jgi:hypothetical protein
MNDSRSDGQPSYAKWVPAKRCDYLPLDKPILACMLAYEMG